MKEIIKLKPKLDLDLAFGINSIELKELEIISNNTITITCYINVLDNNDFESFTKLDTNIRNKISKDVKKYRIEYHFRFENENLQEVAKYLWDYVNYTYNNPAFTKDLEILANDNIVYIKISDEIQKTFITHNKLDHELKKELIKSLKQDIALEISLNELNFNVLEKTKEKSKKQDSNFTIKPLIVDFELGKTITIEAEIFYIDEKEITKKDGGKLKLVSFYVTNNKRSFVCKKFYNDDNDHELKVNDVVEITGTFTKDISFEKDYYIKIKFIKKIASVDHSIIDDSDVKRVELGIRTNMSEMSSNINAKDLNEIMSKMGHSAYAITDLGVVHAFPFVYKKDSDVKAILGLSSYVVDDNKMLVINPKDVDILEEEYVVFDIETTGFDPYNDKIIEIGAVKIKKLEIVDRFSEFINPEIPIPKVIKDLTSISDDDVKDADTVDIVLPRFLEFCKNSTLVAHNAKFDVGFISEKSNQLNISTNFSYIDTIEWAKLTLKDQKRFNLDALCKRFNIDNENHHRAVNDAEVTTKLFIELIKRVLTENVKTLKDVNEKLQLDIEVAEVNVTNILLKSQKGLPTLYKLVSDSLIYNYGNKLPRIKKSDLEKNREELLIASNPSMGYNKSGELVKLYIRGIDKEEIEKAANFYDLIEIYPESKYEKEVKTGEITDFEYVREMNKYFYNLGKKLGKIVVAISDVSYMTKEEAPAKKVLQVANNEFRESKYESNSHFRTTKEMLEEFSYLGEKIAYEVVVENTNIVADMIEKVRPIPDGFYPPKIDGDKEEVKRLTYEKAHELYGENLPKVVQDRIERELNSIIGNNFSVLYLIAQKLVKKSVESGYLVGSRGSVGSSLVAYLMGITEVNGLYPHYRCSKCKYFEIFELEKSGVDLPVKYCEKCNIELIRDGHAIPFEVFMGFNGDKVPDIDLNFSGEFQSNIHKYTEELFGAENTFRAGTISTTAYNNAMGYVKKYFEINSQAKAREESEKIFGKDKVNKEFEKEYIQEDIRKNKAEIERLARMIEGARKTTGQHPGGMVIVPRDKSIYEFSPIQKPANDMTSQSTTTHFDYHVMDAQLVKLDILGHDDPTTLKLLEDLTGLSPYDIPLTDEKVISLFSNTSALNVKPEDIETDLGTNGIPEFGTAFVKGMLKDTRPTSFTELVRISGLSHGTDVWLNNAQYYVNEGIASLNEIITVRDDIMNYLILQGIDKGLSFTIMEFIRKGRPNKDKEKWEEYKKVMQEYKVPSWYIDSCEKIKYMFPKGHAVAYVMMAIRIAYFKVYYPLEFYTAYLNRKISSFTLSKNFASIDKLKKRYYELRDLNSKNVNDKNEVILLEILIEMHYRNIELINVDLYKSKADKFIIEDGKIRLPFLVVDGLGEVVAKNIEEKRKEKSFSSKEDLVKRTGLNSTVLKTMEEYEIIKGMDETDQQSLF
ncbi:PolC-type DNA polymerase III [Oceanivirga miroungae]|uniref:DNA polymerase III PolC-type n=2 Tax=Oceanivirga miroungae TaxID=1130046 RepID=A0A6I8M6N7_9FUSO|nr:PolC-type DNA polymerase III [Oceanivirga miroungae]VWL85562.1 DNA polymerase III subunit alpha [Oceanivirga miroungae]